METEFQQIETDAGAEVVDQPTVETVEETADQTRREEERQESEKQKPPRGVVKKIAKLTRIRHELTAENEFFRRELGKAGLLPVSDSLPTAEWIRRRTLQEEHGTTNLDSFQLDDEDQAPALSADPDMNHRGLKSVSSDEAEMRAEEIESADGEKADDVEQERTPEQEAEIHANRVRTLMAAGMPPEVAEASAKLNAAAEREFPDHFARVAKAIEFVAETDLPQLMATAAKTPLSKGLQREIASLSNSGDVIVELARHPEFVFQMNQLPPGLARQALKDLSANLDAFNQPAGRTKEINQKYNERVTAVRDKYPDFDQVLSADFEATPKQADSFESVRKTIYELDNGPDVAYWLAKHPEERNELLSLTPWRAAARVSTLSDELAESESFERQETKHVAPKPIKPVKKAGPTSSGLDDDLSIGEWMKRRAKQDAARGE